MMFVVTLPASAESDPNAFARKAERSDADMLEIRGDLTPQARFSNPGLPVLLSLRGADPSLVKVVKPEYLDVELSEVDVPVPTGCTRILSYHNYEETPSLAQLRTVLATMLSHKPEIIKIATLARSYADIVTLERLRESMPEGQRHVLLAMGDKAGVQRILSPHRNALTYTFIDDGEAAAPGQLPLRTYRRFAGQQQPALYGLLGGPQCVSSFSPIIHNLLFDAQGIHALYTIFPTEDLADAMQHLPQLGVQGFSVTAPWKRDILAYASSKDELVAELQSANTLVQEHGEWKAYNTDVTGILEGYPFLAKAKTLAIAGTGGVVPSLIYAARRAGVKTITVYGRNAKARTQIGEYFQVQTAPLEDMCRTLQDVVIWAISEDADVALPPVGERHSYAVDLRYAQSTRFLAEAEQLGYDTVNGLPMLLHQAFAQFKLFTGISTDDNLFLSLFNSLRTHGKQ